MVIFRVICMYSEQIFLRTQRKDSLLYTVYIYEILGCIFLFVCFDKKNDIFVFTSIYLKGDVNHNKNATKFQ